MNRTQKATINFIASISGYVITVLCGFITRNIIVRYIGIEMVGIGQLFSTLLLMLSYSQLGLETSIVFGLYVPINKNDQQAIYSILQYYKKVFRCVAIGILVLTLILLPLVSLIIGPDGNGWHIRLILVLYGMNSAATYILAYKRCILIASQKRFISSLFTDCFSFMELVVQALVIILTQNYILYLLVNFFVLGNVAVSLYVDKKFPLESVDKSLGLDEETKSHFDKITVALIEQKLGIVVIFALSALLMSYFTNMQTVGMFSNYEMIINGLQAGLMLFYQSMIAGVGNVMATENTKVVKKTWKTVNFLSFWVCSIATLCFFNLSSIFVGMWLGDAYVFSRKSTLLLGLTLFVNGMRYPVVMFKDAAGLQWYDRRRPILEIMINLCVSIVLVKLMGGLDALLLGRLLSIVLSSAWIEPYMLYKHLFTENIIDYLKSYFFRVMILFFSGFFMDWILNKIMIFVSSRLLCFVFGAVLDVMTICIFVLIIYRKSDEMMMLKAMLLGLLKGKDRRILK